MTRWTEQEYLAEIEDLKEEIEKWRDHWGELHGQAMLYVVERDEARAFGRRCWWGPSPTLREIEDAPKWINDGRLACGCEPHGHKCLIAEGGCGRCVEHCVCGA